LRRIAAADADQRKFLRQALGAVIGAAAATVVAMVDEQRRHLDRAEIEGGKSRARSVGVGYGRAQHDALHDVAEAGTERRGGYRAAACAEQKNLRARKALLEIGYQRADVVGVVPPEAKTVAHASGKLIRRRIDDDVGDLGVGDLITNADQKIRRRTELYRALLRAPFQPDRAE
jgi:hypothetical protein